MKHTVTGQWMSHHSDTQTPRHMVPMSNDYYDGILAPEFFFNPMKESWYRPISMGSATISSGIMGEFGFMHAQAFLASFINDKDNFQVYFYLLDFICF